MNSIKLFLSILMFLITSKLNSQTTNPTDSIISVNKYIENLAETIADLELLEVASDNGKSNKEYTYNVNQYNRLDSLVRLMPK